MQLSLLLICLFAGLKVLALDEAAPWEMMYFYAAYKAEWLSGLDSSQRHIALACKRGANVFPGSDFDAQAASFGVTGMCSFDDFVRFVGDAIPYGRYQPTLEGNMWDIDQYWKTITAKFSLAADPDHSFTVNMQKLLPKAGFGTGKAAYPPTIKQVANALQAAREVTPGLAVVEAQAQYAAEYARITQQLRVKDGAQYPVQTVKKYIAQLLATGLPNPFTVQYKPQTIIRPPAPSTGANIGAYVNELDFDQTLKNNPDGTRNAASGIDMGKFRRFFASDYTKKLTTKEQDDVIQAFHQAIDYLRRNQAGCPLPTTKRDLSDLEESNSLMEDLIIRNRFQDHLMLMEVRFGKMDMVI